MNKNEIKRVNKMNKEILDFDIKKVGGLDIQEAEKEVNINECFSLWFEDFKQNQITLHLDYDGILDLIKVLNEVKNKNE